MPTVAEKYAKQGKVVSGFFAIAKLKEGESFVGTYIQSLSKKIKGRDALTHVFALREWDCSFQREGKEYRPNEGESIELTGAVLDRTLTPAMIGHALLVTYTGAGKGQFGNASKVFEIKDLGA